MQSLPTLNACTLYASSIIHLVLFHNSVKTVALRITAADVLNSSSISIIKYHLYCYQCISLL